MAHIGLTMHVMAGYELSCLRQMASTSGLAQRTRGSVRWPTFVLPVSYQLLHCIVMHETCSVPSSSISTCSCSQRSAVGTLTVVRAH